METKGKPFVKEMLENNVFSVSAYLKLLNSILNSFEGRVKGEVSELKIAASGHVYFSLKDKKDQSIINCVIWNYDYKVCGVELREGLEVICLGVPDVYPVSGRLTFKVKAIQLVGEGELKKEYEKLKKKLEDEGLFSEERKKPIPRFSKNIGIITSKHGAVISDFLNNLGRFGFKVKFIDSRVEGMEAVKDLLSSIKRFSKEKLDVLVIMRGGGSLESFLAFNNESLIREVSNLPFPVISALGHDKDVPLMALATDKMVSTPTAAANLLNQSWQEASWQLRDEQVRIFNLFSSALTTIEYKMESYSSIMKEKLETVFNNFNLIEYRIRSVIVNMTEAAIVKAKKDLEMFERIINQNNPERNLKLGYCIARSKDHIIKKTSDVRIGNNVDLQVSDGVIITNVKNIKK